MAKLLFSVFCSVPEFCQAVMKRYALLMTYFTSFWYLRGRNFFRSNTLSSQTENLNISRYVRNKRPTRLLICHSRMKYPNLLNLTKLYKIEPCYSNMQTLKMHFEIYKYLKDNLRMFTM